MLNDPYRGGTHLPDITVITPAFAPDGSCSASPPTAPITPTSAARRPGSMPADSTTLADEGVVIAPRRLDAAAIDELVAQMRQPAQRRADLRAQLAANRTGVERLRELHARGGLQAAMDETIDYAERRMRACLAALPDGTRRARDVLEAREGDLELQLEATVRGDELTLDFSGSAAQHGGNLNCPLSVTRSACWFAVRVLTDPDIPPTAGAYRPIRVVAPEGSLLNARPPAAVVAGNVETSSRVADLVLAAFGRALGQGTMNNLTLGDDAFTYYETLGGGQGACEDADGPTRRARRDVEHAQHPDRGPGARVPAARAPLRRSARVGRSGPPARRRRRRARARGAGGDGVLAADRAPPACAAGRRRRASPARRGATCSTARSCPPKAGGSLRPGQRLSIETPGGGGFG